MSRLSLFFAAAKLGDPPKIGSVILSGIGRVFSDATVIKPLFSSERCVAVSQGIYPNYTNINAYNMAALPPQFNRFPDPDLCPDIFHYIDILRHKWAMAHDTRSNNFKKNRFTSAEAQEKYLGHRNIPKYIDLYKLQLGVMKDLNKILVSIFNWANEQ